MSNIILVKKLMQYLINFFFSCVWWSWWYSTFIHGPRHCGKSVQCVQNSRITWFSYGDWWYRHQSYCCIDLKLSAILTGIQSCNSCHSCIYCQGHKPPQTARWNTGIWRTYNSCVANYERWVRDTTKNGVANDNLLITIQINTLQLRFSKRRIMIHLSSFYTRHLYFIFS